MRGTFMNHLKVLEREKTEVGINRKMFLTIEPYNPKQSFHINLKDINEEEAPLTPSIICEAPGDEELDDGKNTTKDSESPTPH
jgi:hypothetical protein